MSNPTTVVDRKERRLAQTAAGLVVIIIGAFITGVSFKLFGGELSTSVTWFAVGSVASVAAIFLSVLAPQPSEDK